MFTQKDRWLAHVSGKSVWHCRDIGTYGNPFELTFTMFHFVSCTAMSVQLLKYTQPQMDEQHAQTWIQLFEHSPCTSLYTDCPRGPKTSLHDDIVWITLTTPDDVSSWGLCIQKVYFGLFISLHWHQFCSISHSSVKTEITIYNKIAMVVLMISEQSLLCQSLCIKTQNKTPALCNTNKKNILSNLW